MDYIFRWLQLRFLTGQQQLLFENLRPEAAATCARRHRRSERFLQLQREGRTSAPTEVRFHPRRRRALQHDRHGRRSKLPRLRHHHGEKRQLLQMHELRHHQRLQLKFARVVTGVSPVQRSEALARNQAHP